MTGERRLFVGILIPCLLRPGKVGKIGLFAPDLAVSSDAVPDLLDGKVIDRLLKPQTDLFNESVAKTDKNGIIVRRK